MNVYRNQKLTVRAKSLRKDMTKEDRHLWYDFLKGLPVTVHSQKIFGRYIADFYCAQAKLVIELDGSQHYEAVGREYDLQRDAYLRSLGLTVLRYSNADIQHNFEGVCTDILRCIESADTSSVTAKGGDSFSSRRSL